jgi:micrococcal nuclease
MSDPARILEPMPTLLRVFVVCGLATMMSACVLSAPPTVRADTVTATVLKIVDGDTIDIRDDARGRLRIRLLGLDTPETKKPGFTVR